ncbi:late competence development ComFB family protein [Lutibacter sp. B2]|nr:late competence development ComFB family protein [Lutibacter sp. B2]
MPKNYMETIVDSLLNTVLKSYEDICTCSKCKKDIKAVVLNNVEPLYIVTGEGASYVKLRELNIQFKVSITREIVKAIEVVSKNPKHGE